MERANALKLTFCTPVNSYVSVNDAHAKLRLGATRARAVAAVRAKISQSCYNHFRVSYFSLVVSFAWSNDRGQS